MGIGKANIAGLIISSKKGEFESGFKNGGVTKEHIILANGLGIENLLIIITKMDTINWY